MARLLLVLLVVAASGCMSGPEGAAYQLSGAFTAQRTQADIEEFHEIVAPFSSDVRIMESFPEQFVVAGMSKTGCDDARSQLVGKPYIGSLSQCLSPPRRDEAPLLAT